MKAKFTRGTDSRLGIRFEPETFEEQLLLEGFAQWSSAEYEFRFSSWEQNQSGRACREGLTSVWGELVRKLNDSDQSVALKNVEALTRLADFVSLSVGQDVKESVDIAIRTIGTLTKRVYLTEPSINTVPECNCGLVFDNIAGLFNHLHSIEGLKGTGQPHGLDKLSIKPGEEL